MDSNNSQNYGSVTLQGSGSSRIQRVEIFESLWISLNYVSDSILDFVKDPIFIVLKSKIIHCKIEISTMFENFRPGSLFSIFWISRLFIGWLEYLYL